jgi:hypothetical protein
MGVTLLLISEPQGNNNLEAWWLGSRKLVRKEDRRKLDTLVTLMAWMLSESSATPASLAIGGRH